MSLKPLAPNERWIGEGVVCQDLNWSRELRSLGILGAGGEEALGKLDLLEYEIQELLREPWASQRNLSDSFPAPPSLSSNGELQPLQPFPGDSGGVRAGLQSSAAVWNP